MHYHPHSNGQPGLATLRTTHDYPLSARPTAQEMEFSAMEDRRRAPDFQLPRPTPLLLERVSLKTLALCRHSNSVWSDAQVMANQPMSTDVRQPTPPCHDARVGAAYGKFQGRIPLFSQLLDGVRDLSVDFEYVTSAVNKCSESVGIGVPGVRPEPRAEMQGRT